MRVNHSVLSEKRLKMLQIKAERRLRELSSDYDNLPPPSEKDLQSLWLGWLKDVDKLKNTIRKGRNTSDRDLLTEIRSSLGTMLYEAEFFLEKTSSGSTPGPSVLSDRGRAIFKTRAWPNRR